MKSIKKNIFNVFILSIILLCFLTSCKKLVDVDPPVTSTNSAIVFSTDANAIAALTGIYTQLSRDGLLTPGPLRSISLAAGLNSDELIYYGTNSSANLNYANFINDLSPASNGWADTYSKIFAANLALEGLSASNTLSPAVKQQLLGEAKFFRAFCYFYLVNLYGDVPLVLSTDYKVNAVMGRSPKTVIYQQIIEDLKEAKVLLSSDFLNASLVRYATAPERVRPTKWVAEALLARSYLYTGDYVNAETEASLLIGNSDLFTLPLLNQVFLKNSKETIWSLQPLGSANLMDANTAEGYLFNLLVGRGPEGSKPVYLSDRLLSSFEPFDQRRSAWTSSVTLGAVTYPFAYKYKIGQNNLAATSEYTMVFRLAEQYLIRAEARIKLQRIEDGIKDLNILRLRASDPNAAPASQLASLPLSLTKDVALQKLEHERRVELFTEWGHRWFDLKRTQGFSDLSKSRADEVLGPIKGVNWQSTDQLWPIPQDDILKNPTMAGQQNPGYK